MRIYFFLYAVILVLFSFFSYFYVDYNLVNFNIIYSGYPYDHRSFFTILYILFITVLFFGYIFILKKFSSKEYSFLDLKKLIMIQVVSLFFSYPAMLSYDIFNYIFTSKVLFFYRENPYIVMPIEFMGDPNLAFTHAANKLALYGFVWIIFSGVPFILGFGNFVLTVFSFKLFVVFFYLLTTFLIYRLSRSAFSAAFFALNPLVVVESLISSHNDVVMMGLVLLSFYFLFKNKYLFSIFFLILSIFIKYSTLFLIPIFVYYFVHKIRSIRIDLNRLFLFGFFSMVIIFILSPLREEIYPWYFIWVLTFFSLLKTNKYILHFVSLFSFCLLLRYAPFMLSGTYFGNTPVLKELITFILPSAIFLGLLAIERLWRRRLFT